MPQTTKEERAIYLKEWHAKKLSEDPAYYVKKNQRYKEYNKAWSKTEKGIKLNIMNGWKNNGLVHDNYDELYEHYINTHSCDVCKKDFKDSFDRCMDHCHTTGLFRQVLCRYCNIKDNWKNVLKNNIAVY